MTNAKSTKRALITSALAVLMCVAMLIGTTFAWFTDTASTGVNKIQAGNLDVELEYSYDMNTWETATSRTKLFDDNTLWEPGVTEVVYLRVKNNGTLALKYTMGLNSNVGFANGINKAGETYNIGDYLKMGTAAVSEKLASRDAAWAAVEATADTMSKLKPFTDGMPILAAGETSDAMALVIYMPTEVGNEANAGTKASYVYRLGVEVFATQATVEEDSFDNTYDAKAPVIFKPKSSTYETYELTENIQANGGYGAVQVEGATVTINADVYAVYSQGNGAKTAMAVKAGGTGHVIINGGDFRQVGVPASDPVCDLIYVTGSATVEINGGTFKAVSPDRTLNILDSDRATAKIIVKGGSFYKFNPATDNAGEITVPDGYSVIKDGDWYTVIKGVSAVAGTQEEINTAIGNNSDVTVKLTAAGTYSLPDTTGKEVSIIGTKDTVIDMKNKTNKAQSLSFKGVTVNFGDKDYCGFQHTGKLTYENCTITGKQFLYGNEVEFKNCVFEQDAVDYNVWTYGAGTVLFNNCTFNCKGKSVLIYNEGSISGQTVEFRNCKFNASAPAAGKAAIEIDSSLLNNGATYNVIIDKATADSVTGFDVGSKSGNSVWNDKKGTKATVVVDGETVLSAN